MSYSCLSPRLLLNLFDDDDRAVTFRPTIEFTIYSRVARSRTRVSPRFDIHHLPSSPSFSYFRSFLQFERNESKSGWRKPSNKKHDAATDTISVKNNQCPVAAHLWYIYTYIYICMYIRHYHPSGGFEKFPVPNHISLWLSEFEKRDHEKLVCL